MREGVGMKDLEDLEREDLRREEDMTELEVVMVVNEEMGRWIWGEGGEGTGG